MSDEAASARDGLDSRIGTLLFGDRLGLLLFLSALGFVWLYWRAGVFITDTNTLVRTLDAVSGGTFVIDDATGTHFSAPGAVVHDGLVYGRNYGQAVLALPFLWTIEAISAVANVRVALLAGWHLILLAILAQLARFWERRRLAVTVGSALVIASFLLNVVLATGFANVPKPLLALQLGSMVAGGAVAVLLYRLCRRLYDVRTAMAAGGAGVFVLPVGFWAPVPKRHVLVAAILLGILYLFAVSRSPNAGVGFHGIGPLPIYRAGAYGLVGLLAWIHAAEALFVFIPLVLVDLPTAPRNDVRELGFVLATFLVALLPFFLTNWLISGDILEPPRALSQSDDPRTTNFIGGADGSGGGSGGGGYPGSAIVAEILWLWSVTWTQISRSLSRLANLDAVLGTWIRSGSLDRLASGGVPEFRAVNLAVLESVPLFGGFLATAGVLARRRLRSSLSAVRPTDALALGLVVGFVLLYMQDLPIHVQVTVRYLLPTYPLLIYLGVRLLPIRRLLKNRLGYTLWAYAAVVLIGSQLVLAAVVLANETVSEAVQLHGILGLGAATFLGVSALAAAVADRFEPVAAVALGVAAGAGTVFILLSGLAYFSFVGQYVLPMAGAVADLIGRI